MDKDSIVLGSGKLFIDEFVEGAEIPADELIEIEEHRIGYIKGGCTLEYKPEFYTAEDDLGRVSKTILTKEEAVLKTGLITWCANTLEQLCTTGRVTTAGNKRTIKIGGVGNQTGKKYIIRFLHEDAEDGDIRITIVGNNQAGFTLAMLKDEETTVDAEFKAHPMDKEGTLITYTEDFTPAPEAAAEGPTV